MKSNYYLTAHTKISVPCVPPAMLGRTCGLLVGLINLNFMNGFPLLPFDKILIIHRRINLRQRVFIVKPPRPYEVGRGLTAGGII